VAFQNVGASIKACRAIAELITNSHALAQLHLFNNMSDNEVCPELLLSMCIDISGGLSVVYQWPLNVSGS